MELFEELTSLMTKYSFSPNRQMGQHFIIDEETVKKIVEEAKVQQEDTALEIGAGTGFLTREICRHCKTIAFEKDENLADLLRQEIKNSNLEVRNEDFLQAELPKFTKIVSFPPYRISSKIMQRLFETEFESGVIVFQKEFAAKLTAFPGLHEYNAMSVLAQYYFAVIPLFRIPKKSFFPKPEVDSAAIKLVAKKRFGQAKSEEFFREFIKQIFRYGNKNLEKAVRFSRPFLKKHTKKTEAQIGSKLGKSKFKNKKVDLMEISELVEVFNRIFFNEYSKPIK